MDKTFIVEGEFSCCGRKAQIDRKLRAKRESQAPEVRAKPTAHEMRRILDDQGHCCIYCQRPFNSWVYRRKNSRPVRLTLEWDHLVPFSYSYNNNAANFVAACKPCNGIKSSKMFATLEDARIDITLRWELKYRESPEDG
jgi:5-methylcytosine-specific restriction endonuclease McrA